MKRTLTDERACLLLAMSLLIGGPALAQDAGTESGESREIDALEPGVDTSESGTDEGTDDTAADAAAGDEDGEIERTESGGRVMDRMELGRTEITGNQELPKVLYIVPWQKANHGDLSGRPVNTLLDEVLAPVDREEFIRTVEYYRELNGDGPD